MPKQVEFKFGGHGLVAALDKVNRSEVYGWSEVEVLNKEGGACEMAYLLDGRHVMPSGSMSMVKLDAGDRMVSTGDLVGFDADGHKVDKVPSVFDGPVTLTDGALDDYLALGVKAVYRLVMEEEGALVEKLRKGALYRLAFNYRADYEADDAFLISNGEAEFLVSGQVADLEFLSKEQQAVLVEDEVGAEEAADDLMDFSMF